MIGEYFAAAPTSAFRRAAEETEAAELYERLAAACAMPWRQTEFLNLARECRDIAARALLDGEAKGAA